MSTVLSVHRGSKVALSACICRLPLVFTEPDHIKKYREWRQDWEIRTKNKLNIADGLAYLKTPGHFLPSVEERDRRKRVSEAFPEGSSPNTSNMSEVESNDIDALLASEGIPELKFAQNDLKESQWIQKIQQEETQALEKNASDVLWLIVNYKHSLDVWTFPFGLRRENDSAQRTLRRICMQQIGVDPHFSSFSPIAFRKVSHTSNESSTRLFYYKSIHVPKTTDPKVPNASPVSSFEWVPRSELQTRLSPATWKSVRDSLPLE